MRLSPKEAAPTGPPSRGGALAVALAALLFSLLLFGNCQQVRDSRALGSVLGEANAALSDAGTQWMVFACAGVYFLTFLFLRRRMSGTGRTGTRWNASLPDDIWLLGLLALVAVAYALDYTHAVSPTQALSLVGGAMVGQGVALWESRKPKVESRNRGGETVLAVVVLLTIAAMWQGEAGHVFQYRGQGRWAGPWDNPNTFGMLMGVGVVLALGKAESRKQKAARGGEHPTSNIQHRTSSAPPRPSTLPSSVADLLRRMDNFQPFNRVFWWGRRLFFLAAAGVMGWGLVKSYSRGAWVGTAIGMAYLAYQIGKAEKLKAEMLKGGHKWVPWFIVLVGSLGVLGFWGFRDTERVVARRAFSVGNVNDFSWRNRLSAYEGSLQMMASKPWLGFGWNQPERAYDQFYRPPQVAEGAAIQLNDYFTLGTALGLPALLCFVAYVGSALARPRTTDHGPRTTDYGMMASCHAGTLVLLVGFWFDGGLFKLATASTFWILLELGREGGRERREARLNELNELHGLHGLHEGRGQEAHEMTQGARDAAAEINRGIHEIRGKGGFAWSGFRVFRVFSVFSGSAPLSAFHPPQCCYGGRGCFLLFLFGAALLWARARDPFRRVEFSLQTPSAGRAKGIAILPKPVGRLPVVIYLQGSGGSVLGSGNELRQVAEFGLAAVGLDYNQTNYGVFEEQFIALQQYLQQQPWAQSNATAWVGYSLGAQRILSFALRHPELQPQLIVRRAGGWVPELGESEHPTSNIQHRTSNQPVPLTLNSLPRQSEAAAGQLSTSASPSTLNPKRPSTLNPQLSTPVLLIHGERDEVFPVADCRRLAETLRADGTPVEVRIFPEMGHVAGEESGPVVRALAEYCAAKLPLADYWSEATSQRSAVSGQRSEIRSQRSEVGSQSAGEAERFNLAMRRAGQHRRELWRAVTAFGEPERHTVMNVIGGLEDYDLAHILAAQLEQLVARAWQARKTYPWCRDAPLDIFERFVANPRIYEEPLGKPALPFVRGPSPRVKYCRDTGEASDAVGAWLYSRMRFRTAPPAPESSVEQLLEQKGWCREGAIMYTYVGRLMGLPMRPVHVIWPTLGSSHWYTEVWSTEENQWHAVDSANEDRTYHTSWILNVRKSSILATTGERGGWNAVEEQRWEAFTNTIGLFYPSGQVLVRVLDQDRPVEGQRVVAQAWLSNQVFSVLAARTDAKGEARLTLGRTARYPYRILTEGPGETDWQWLTVQSNQVHSVTLDLGKTRAFDKSVEPPAPVFSSGEKNK